MRTKGLKAAFVDSMVNAMIADGERLLMDALFTKTFTDRTYNLYDSYGFAVYVNGKIRLESIRTVSSKAKKIKKWYNTYLSGSDVIIDYLKTVKASPKGVSIIIAAAMPYASILEGGIGLNKKYKVISGAYSSMEEVASKYGGTLKRL